MVISVYRSTGKTEEESIRKCGTHLCTKITLLRAMSFIHQKYDIVTSIDHLTIGKISKFEDSCYEDFSLMYLLFKLFL